MADIYKIGVSIALANGMSPVLAIISRDLMGVHTKVGDIEKGMGRWALAAGGAAAILGGAAIFGGMLKLALLARAMALDPGLLFLDESTAGLDPQSAAEVDALVLLRDLFGLSIVMITHDLDTLFRTCGRVGVLVDRRMVTDTLEGMLNNDNPWIREYFHGPRARAERS